MALPMHSQNISIKPNRVQTVVTPQGDTLVQFRLKDAKKILADLLDKEIVDSLLIVYEERDTSKNEVIKLKTEQIRLLQQKSVNHEQQITNLNQIIANKDTEIALANEEIKKQKKEIRKQKILKTIGFIGSVVLPIITLLLIL